MSRAGVDQAVEGISEDKDLAERVLGDGASALTSFDLSDEEQMAIVAALRRDVEEAGGEVSGFAQVDFFAVSPNNLMAVGRSFGGAGMPGGGSQTGWHEAGWIELNSQTEM